MIQGTVDYDFGGAVTRTSGTRLTRANAGTGVGNISDGPTVVWTGGPAKVFAEESDLTVIAGGMYGNNKVIMKGTVAPSQGTLYAFCANTSTEPVHTVLYYLQQQDQEVCLLMRN